ALKPWISRRDTLDPFLIRRDPRDLSRIWVLDPDGHLYVEVPYRTMANPVVSLWEHQRALARLHERGIAQVDEEVLFRMIGQMRDIASTASKTTKRMRRDAERRRTTAAVATSGAQNPGTVVPPDSPDDEPPDAPSPAITVAGFDQIEQW
ncbi:transposase, partial [Cryobacterium sp. MLB-32]|uniref:Mu transposase C-terminal domain-containing protein n=1 Tax=Cryobacterium sp. MLB-32 TaxID=1529318 RepID=UPI0004E7497A